MKWVSIINDSQTKRNFLDTINSLTDVLLLNSSEHNSLLGGNSGISLFWEYLLAPFVTIQNIETKEGCLTDKLGHYTFSTYLPSAITVS